MNSVIDPTLVIVEHDSAINRTYFYSDLTKVSAPVHSDANHLIATSILIGLWFGCDSVIVLNLKEWMSESELLYRTRFLRMNITQCWFVTAV